MDAKFPTRPRWRLLAASLAMAAALAAGCQDPPGQDTLRGHFGPGAGGPPLSGATASIALTKSNGEPVGQADYDPMEFAPLGPAAADQFENLAEATGTLGIALSRITGRPDTPCHFQAALLARDQGYEILASGTRKNDQALEFSQVNLAHGGTGLSLFCATLRDEVGVLIEVLADSPEKIDWVQVHYLLNSVRKS
jgi:hypothetical protein